MLYTLLNKPTGNECNPKWKAKDSKTYLRESQVTTLTNMNPKRKNKKTYLYVPPEFTSDGKEVFVSSSGLDPGTEHAEDNMYDALGKKPPKEFWINNTPCPCCAQNLIKRYADAKIDTPRTIRFIHFYTLPSKSANPKMKIKNPKDSETMSLECMAKMMLNGFQFEPWDWEKFGKDYLTEEECKNSLKAALKEESTAKQLEIEKEKAKNAINKAKKLIICNEDSVDKLCQHVCDELHN